MIRENQKILNRANIFTDAVLLLFAMIFAYGIRFGIFQGELHHITLVNYLKLGVVVIPVYLFIYLSLGLYESFRHKTFTNELGLIIKSNLTGLFMLLALLFIFKQIDLSRWTLVIFFCLNIMLTGTKRFVLRYVLHQYRSKGYNIKHVIIIGSGATALSYIKAINENKSLGFFIIGYISNSSNLEALSYLGEYKDTYTVLDSFLPDEVIIALEASEFDFMQNIVSSCEKSGTKLSIVPFYSQYMPSKPYMDDIEGIPLINLRRIPLDNLINALMKRTFDIFASLGLIVLFSPIMIFTAIGTKLSSKGPVIFKQERVGLNKTNFTMYKFRSMKVNQTSNTAWTTDSDPRKTKFGSFIRKFSIDELPQFFNVLKGDMSLVGPRPEIPFFVDRFKESVPLYMVKHQVRPGITGWAQVNGYRGDTSIQKRIEHDIYYIENWSFLFDIKILLMTLFKGVINTEKLK